MISIPQYGSMFSLYISILAAIPSVILAFFGRKSRIINLLASLIMIICIMGLNSLQFLEFVLFLCGELLLVFFYLWFRSKYNCKTVYFLVFFLSLCPILLVRMAPHITTATYLFGFVGLSYMCFKIWQLLFEIHDGKITCLSLLDVLNFLLFFPSFSSGPIARYQGFLEQQNSRPTREVYVDEYLFSGFRKIFTGLLYKFALAFFINTYVLIRIPQEATFINVVLYMYGYTLYLFFDFAGYSLIAIGTGMLMGIKLPENFDKPFLACNMKEFWSRWHMSLSTWFNDYIFGRFVLNNVRNGLFKSTKIAARWAYMVTMLTMGLWHGFTLHYAIYGLYQGALLVTTDFYVKSKLYRNARKKTYYSILSRVVCFQFIAFGMLLFSGQFWFV